MGYSTDFKGVLALRDGTTVEELRRLKSFLGVDCRDDDNLRSYGLDYIDMELTDDLSGLRWNGAEKTRGMKEAVEMILNEMRGLFHDFTLTGTLQAQGEDADDRWDLIAEGDSVRIVKYVMVGERVKCPNCHNEFVPNGKWQPS
jgi:aryl carrier-like protein